jgi:TolB protein
MGLEMLKMINPSFLNNRVLGKGNVRRRAVWFLILSFALLLVACLPDGVQLPESDLLRYLERKSGLIAYVGLDGNVYTIDQAGRNQTALTEDAQVLGTDGRFLVYQHLTWSPDSQKLGFVGASGARGAVEKMSILVSDPDGEELVEAFSSNTEVPFYLYWAPDSEQIGFLSSSTTREDLLLQIANASGGDIKSVDTGEPYYWQWAPEGNQMLVHEGGSAQGRLSILTIGSFIDEKRFPYEPTFFQAPGWSPDGQQLLMAVQRDEGQGALILADRAGDLRQELASFENGVAFALSPNGEKVAYIANSDFAQIAMFGQLSVVDLANPAETIRPEENFVEAFFWSPDGEKIAYFTPVLVEGEKGPNGRAENVVLQALHMLDVQTGESQRVTVFRPTETFLRVFPYFDQYHHSLTIWSPDSRYLVLSSFDNENDPGIWVIAASGSSGPRFLAQGEVAFWSWK